jgi:hypothetical protein
LPRKKTWVSIDMALTSSLLYNRTKREQRQVEQPKNDGEARCIVGTPNALARETSRHI